MSTPPILSGPFLEAQYLESVRHDDTETAEAAMRLLWQDYPDRAERLARR